jgi:hypothetical protein
VPRASRDLKCVNYLAPVDVVNIANERRDGLGSPDIASALVCYRPPACYPDKRAELPRRAQTNRSNAKGWVLSNLAADIQISPFPVPCQFAQAAPTSEPHRFDRAACTLNSVLSTSAGRPRQLRSEVPNAFGDTPAEIPAIGHPSRLSRTK